MPNKQNMIASLYETFAFETITITNEAKKLTVATFTESTNVKAKRAIITVENAQLRYRMDGEDSSATVGHLLNPMDSLIIIGNQNMLNFRAIKKGTTNSKISVSYEK